MIVKTISTYFGIKSTDIMGRSQTKENAHPRQIAMHFCRHRLKMPFMGIGKFFQRDHSTVMTSVRTIDKEINKRNNDTFYEFKQLSKKIEDL
jgi:chromosomal replication initiator protein